MKSKNKQSEIAVNPAWLLLTQETLDLPALPSVLNYWDDFDEEHRKIDNYRSSSKIKLYFNGNSVTISLAGIHETHSLLVKHVVWYLFSEGCRPATVAKYLRYLKTASDEDVLSLMVEPETCRLNWLSLRAKHNIVDIFSSFKSLLRFCCSQYLCGWSPDYFDFLKSEFSLPAVSAYEAVESGDAFLEQSHEKLIITYFDELSVSLRKGISFSTHRLEDSAMLMCAYQFGMRPIQIATLKHEDVKEWSDGSKEVDSSVHVRFAMAKQRSSDKIQYLPRKIKTEWSVVWRELIRRKSNAHGRFFSVTSSQEAGLAVSRLAKEIAGETITAGVFRHSAAQRLVDSGASSEELAAFMGHSSLQTGLVYYRASPAQAELVNKALGISAVYKKIQHIAHAKFISKEDLATLKGEQQIGGIPHGIPIAGIGGCTTGQPACPYNPVTACYGCSRFMPVADVEMHKKVLQDFRGVARFFFDESKNDSSSPAYLQLKRTITSVEAIIDELEGR